VAVLEILGSSSLDLKVHRKVLDGMTDQKEYTHKRARFQSIINDLGRNTSINRDNLDRNTAIYRDDLTLCQMYYVIVNAVLSYGPEQESLKFR